jgi:hypothetical protein
MDEGRSEAHGQIDGEVAARSDLRSDAGVQAMTTPNGTKPYERCRMMLSMNPKKLGAPRLPHPQRITAAREKSQLMPPFVPYDPSIKEPWK